MERVLNSRGEQEMENRKYCSFIYCFCWLVSSIVADRLIHMIHLYRFQRYLVVSCSQTVCSLQVLQNRQARMWVKQLPHLFCFCNHWMSIYEPTLKQGLSIIWSKRGGDVFLRSHSKWLQTVSANPEAILFKFVPITSLLTGVPGSGYLSHAINLYLRCKWSNCQIYGSFSSFVEFLLVISIFLHHINSLVVLWIAKLFPK